MEQKGLSEQVEVMTEHWKYTVSGGGRHKHLGRKWSQAKRLKVESEETADQEQWTHGLTLLLQGSIHRDGQEQLRWMQTIEEWAAQDPLQDKTAHSGHRNLCSLGGDEDSQGPGRGSSDSGDVAEPPDTIEAQSDSPLRWVLVDAAACESTRHAASGAHGGDPEAGRSR